MTIKKFEQYLEDSQSEEIYAEEKQVVTSGRAKTVLDTLNQLTKDNAHIAGKFGTESNNKEFKRLQGIIETARKGFEYLVGDLKQKELDNGN